MSIHVNAMPENLTPCGFPWRSRVCGAENINFGGFFWSAVLMLSVYMLLRTAGFRNPFLHDFFAVRVFRMLCQFYGGVFRYFVHGTAMFCVHYACRLIYKVHNKKYILSYNMQQYKLCSSVWNPIGAFRMHAARSRQS